MKQTITRLVLAASSIAHASGALAQTPPGAMYTHRYDHFREDAYYVDFSAVTTVSGRRNYLLFPSPDGLGSVKFVDLQLAHSYTQAIDPGRCLQFRFYTPIGGTASDIKLWAQMSGYFESPTVWAKVADNTSGTFPVARVWIRGGSGIWDAQTIVLRAAAKAPQWNTAAFWVAIRDLGTDQAACEAAPSSVGVFRVIDGNKTVVRTGN